MAYTTYYPVFLNLAHKLCLVVGGGKIAAEKVNGLLKGEATIRVVSPALNHEMQELYEKGAFEWIQREFLVSDVDEAFLVIGATDDRAVNREIFAVGDDMKKLSNAVDDPANCNFILAATTRSGPLQIAVSSAGCSPALAQRIRDRITHEMLGPEVAELTEYLGDWRPAVKQKIDGFAVRKAFWEGVLDSDVVPHLAAGRRHEADMEMNRLLDQAAEKQTQRAS